MTALTKTNVGLNLLRDVTRGVALPIITYFAVGTGNSTPTAAQTKLDSESFRKLVSTYTVGSNGEIFITVYLAPNDANGIAITEVGVFGSTTATSTANSGIMIGRGLYSVTKTNLQSINLQLDLTFA